MYILHNIKITIFPIILILFLLTIKPVFTIEATTVLLNGTWEYQKGFTDSYFNSEINTDWLEISMPGLLDNINNLKGYRGPVTLRKEIEKKNLDRIFHEDELVAFKSGIVMDSCKFYFNKNFIGKVGEFSPYKSGRERIFIGYIKKKYINNTGKNYFYIVIFKNTDFNNNGLLGPNIEIGNVHKINKDYYLNIQTSWSFLVLYLIIAIFYIYLGSRRIKNIYNLLYGLFVIFFALWSSANMSQWEQLYANNYLLKYIIDRFSLKASVIFYILFISQFYYNKYKLIYKIQVYFLLTQIIFDFIFFTISKKAVNINYNIFFIFLLIGIIIVIKEIISQLKNKKFSSYLHFACMSVIAIASIHDILLLLGIINSIYLTPYSFPIFIVGGAIILIENFVEIHYKLEDLTLNLEKKIQLRTKELEIANLELKKLTLSDPLTNLHNRRFVSEILFEYADNFLKLKTSPEVKKRNLKMDDKVLGVFSIDIDFFKQINDTYGHNAGDKILKEISELFKKSTRFDDNIVRWGGEEFLIILNKTEVKYVTIFAKKIKQTIESYSFVISNKRKVNLTISIGLTTFPFFNRRSNQFNFEQCINLSDQALYIAKRTGRNRAVFIKNNGIKYEYSYKEISDILSKINNDDDIKNSRLNIKIIT